MTYPLLTQQQLDKLLSGVSVHSFAFNIARMHDIYRLPKSTEPTLEVGDTPISRLTKFQKTLADELTEFDTASPGKLSIKDKLLALDGLEGTQLEEMRQECLTDIADWLADIIVYCRSEAMKFGLPLEDVQDAVMGSNFTKLPSDGVPIYDDNGKVLKDLTNFIPPESAIRTMLFGLGK